MTQKKLEIIGPYTPEHEGPFCTRDGRSVRLLTKTDGSREFPIVGFINNERTASVWTDNGCYFEGGTKDENDLMNAREAPVAREFWIGLTANGANVYNSGNAAVSDCISHGHPVAGTIHVREVLPGEGA